MKNNRIVGLGIAAMICSLVFNGQLFGASATGDGTEEIHACKVLSMSILRMVDDPEDCTPVIEEAVSWRVGPENGTEFPLTCKSCVLSGATWLQNRDLTNAYLHSVEFFNTDFSSSTLVNAYLAGSSFGGSDFSNANFTNAKLNGTGLQNIDMTGATFVNADLSNADLTGSTGLTTSSISGTVWDDSRCPDGSDSDVNGDTCLNHLAP
ncbi:pentapeptide repeat-containing protein [Patescibacteria group bacterium]|jgi:hypothetical protein|nr:pentapeptide repeat-containing protein [Patescibacteria group bacterium]